MFGDACVPLDIAPELHGDTLYVDGSPLKILTIKQADIHPTSIVHVPDIGRHRRRRDLQRHPPDVGSSTPSEWQDWIATVDFVESLRPRMIVAGHRRPDGDDYATADMIAQTRST